MSRSTDPMTIGRFRGSAVAVSATILLTTAIFSASASASLVASARYTDASGRIQNVQINGISNSQGLVWFNTTINDGPLAITWNYTVNPKPTPNAFFNGATTVKNNGATAIQTRVEIDFELCPLILSNSKFGGTTNVKLVANANGGKLTCGSGPHLAGVRVNGASQFIHYWCPFEMTSTGAGTAQTSTSFGQPIPAASGPPNVSAFGHFGDFTLTDGDTAILTAYTVATGNVSYMPSAACPFDVNGDGIVDKWDLVALLMQFGTEGSCNPADLNGDGIVNGLDLGMLVGSWGVCPP